MLFEFLYLHVGGCKYPTVLLAQIDASSCLCVNLKSIKVLRETGHPSCDDLFAAFEKSSNEREVWEVHSKCNSFQYVN